MVMRARSHAMCEPGAGGWSRRLTVEEKAVEVSRPVTLRAILRCAQNDRGLAAWPRSVVVPRLEEIDAAGGDEVDDAVLLRKATRPRTGGKESKRLRLAGPLERIAHHGLDEIHST
jgi:hypothetical protein